MNEFHLKPMHSRKKRYPHSIIVFLSVLKPIYPKGKDLQRKVHTFECSHHT